MDFDFITFKMFQWNDWDMPYLNLNIYLYCILEYAWTLVITF